jgi:hypothetical protein
MRRDETMRSAKHGLATINFATILRKVASTVAPVFMTPALVANINWADGIFSPWNLAAVVSILVSAVFVEASWHARSWTMSPVYLLLALVAFACNAQVALEGISLRSDHRSDHRKTAMISAKNQQSQRSQWSQGRAEAATVAGETAPTTYQSEIDAKIASDSRRWQQTEQCNPLRITAGPSREFCSAIESLKAKKSAAERRDDLDRKIEDLDKTRGTDDVPETADPYAETIAIVAAMLGKDLTETQKRAFSAGRDIIRAMFYELAATFGPSAWLIAITGLFAGANRLSASAAARSEAKSEKREKTIPKAPKAEVKPEPASAPEPAVALDDPFHRYVSVSLEECSGVTMPAGEPWNLWQSWCAGNNHQPGTQKAFGIKMKARYAWEKNNNRPRYLNIRAKSTKPNLRVVASNAA